MGVPFTVSTTFGIVRSDSTARKTLSSLAHGIGDLSEETSLTIKVANGQSEQSITLGGVSPADVLFIRSDQEITVIINRSTPANGEGFTLLEDGFLLLLGASISTLHVSNSSGSEATVEIYVAG